MSTSIITRQTAGTGATVKGAPLTNAEVDTNFIALNQATQPAGGTAGQVLAKIDLTDFNSQWIDNYAVQVKLPVKNSTGSTIQKGSVVYISGASGANALISLANANSDATSATTIGFLESTLNNGDSGLVVVIGVISGIDTSAATEGDPVWLSGTTPGGVVYGYANEPQAPVHIVYLGTVTRAHATVGEIQVNVNNGWELSELHDVKIVSKANNDSIFYSSSLGVWVNVPPATARTNLGLGTLATQNSLTSLQVTDALGYTPYNPAGQTVVTTSTLNTSAGITGSFVGTTDTQTLTNKRITSRVVTIASATSITFNSDTSDVVVMSNTAAAGTFTINAPTGTPTDGQRLTFRLTSTNVQTFSWNAAFLGSTDLPLPTASSGGGKEDYMGFMYDLPSTKWHLIAKTFGY